MTVSLHRIIGTRGEFHQALREALSEMADVGCREAWISDEDFADWPLNEPAVVDTLTQWAQSHRRFTVIARDYGDLARRHPRWVEWRRRWSHVVECLAFEEAEAGQIPTLLLASELVVVRLVDALHHRGSLSHEAGDLVRHRELVDAISQRSVPSFPPTVLGL